MHEIMMENDNLRNNVLYLQKRDPTL
uniref:Uncharacterized protein n=1 Tax=Anguilla anguilla TaxID=7936 RepID=A0A0E9WLV1_ANGAN